MLAEAGDVSHEEIGAILDVPKEKVKALVFQARSSLIASKRPARRTARPSASSSSSSRAGRCGATRCGATSRSARAAGSSAARSRTSGGCSPSPLPVVPTVALKQAVLGGTVGAPPRPRARPAAAPRGQGWPGVRSSAAAPRSPRRSSSSRRSPAAAARRPPA